eukprot:1292484-Rhodomonas_salina.1
MDISDSSRSAPPGVAENAPTFPIIDALSGNSIQINLPLGSRKASQAVLACFPAPLRARKEPQQTRPMPFSANLLDPWWETQCAGAS